MRLPGRQCDKAASLQDLRMSRLFTRPARSLMLQQAYLPGAAQLCSLVCYKRSCDCTSLTSAA